MKNNRRVCLLFGLLLTGWAVPAGAVSALPSRLPVLGMVWWVLPVLFVGGILLAVIGWKRHIREEEKDGADKP